MPDKTLAFYIRLSMEDGDLKGSADKKESNSITNQRKLLMNYYESHPDLKKYQIIEFCDDGFSGTNFDRPQFTRMIEMLRNREIDTVMVKDLSRFGRDHLEVGGYLELLFPLFGTRFISVNDNFDTNDYVGTTGGLELAIRNLVNGMYSKDLSLKIRSANQARRKQGFYHSCGHAFYGYQLDPIDKRKLIVDTHLFCLKASSQNKAECAAIHESMEVLQDKTLSVVQAIARILLDKSKFEKKYDVTEQAQLERLIADMERRRRQIANGKSSLYEEYRNGHISRERFVKIQSDNKAEDERLQQKIAEKNVVLNECIQKQKALALAGQDAEQIQALTEYRPEVISRLIDKVQVFEGGRIEIGLKSKYLTDIIGECIPGLAS